MSYLRGHEKVAEIATAQGWSDSTLAGLLLQFIDGRGEYPDLVEHLQEVRDEENGACDPSWPTEPVDYSLGHDL